MPDWFEELKRTHPQFVNEDDGRLPEQEAKKLVQQRMTEVVLAHIYKKSEVEITKDETAYLVERLKTADQVASNVDRIHWISRQQQLADLRTEQDPKWDFPDYQKLRDTTRRLGLIWGKPYNQQLVQTVLAEVFDLAEEQLSRVYSNNTKVWTQRIAHVLSTLTRRQIHKVNGRGSEAVYNLIPKEKG